MSDITTRRDQIACVVVLHRDEVDDLGARGERRGEERRERRLAARREACEHASVSAIAAGPSMRRAKGGRVRTGERGFETRGHGWTAGAADAESC